jgi:opacity protein-like surface antigen
MAGLGLIHAWTEEPEVERSQDDFALAVGAGVMFTPGKHVGLRADLRYVRAFVDESKLDGVLLHDYGFWRATIGVSIGSLSR